MISRQATDVVQGSLGSYSRASLVLHFSFSFDFYVDHIHSLRVQLENSTERGATLDLSGEMDAPLIWKSQWPYTSPAFQPDTMDWKYLRSLLDEWIYRKDWGIDYLEIANGYTSMMTDAPVDISIS